MIGNKTNTPLTCASVARGVFSHTLSTPPPPTAPDELLCAMERSASATTREKITRSVWGSQRRREAGEHARRDA